LVATLVGGFCSEVKGDVDMRRVIGASVVIFVMLLPMLVSAQGLFGFGVPWAGGPALGNLGAYSGPGGAICCPSVYVGYEIRQGKDRKPLNFGLDFARSFGIDSVSLDFSSQRNIDFSDPGGLWLGISNYCQLSDRVGIMASGWYLFPSSGDAEERNNIGLGISFDETSLGIQFGLRKIWNTTRSWGWLDAMAVLGSPCGMNLMAGFRWDSFTVRLTDPRLVVGGVTLPLFGEADLTLNSYIPLIGTQYCCGGPCCGLLVRVVGFPWVPGNLRYGETDILGLRLQANGNYDRGRFLEVFSEYSRKCGDNGCLGFFARWNYLEVRSHAKVEILPPIITAVDISGPIRTSWTVGGKATLNFNTPFCGAGIF
jgi:hypothetical protein